MGFLKLFVDTVNKRLVKSMNSAEAYTIPKLVYEDTCSVFVCFLEPNPTGTQSAPFTVVDPAPYTLKIGIGQRGGVPYAIQDTWTKTTGAMGNFQGYLDLGQTNMGTAMASNQQITGILEVEVNSLAGGYETLIQQEVTIFNQVIDSGGAGAPTPVDQYHTKAEAGALFVGFTNAAGLTIKLRSPNNLWELEIGQNDDGSVKMETTAVP
jgi:hypothetical protein